MWLGNYLKNKVVFDGRNIYDKSYLIKAWVFEHYGIGTEIGSLDDLISLDN